MRCHHSVKQCFLCARSTHDVHHEIVCVNVAIGVLVVHCELHVIVRVHVPLVVCDEAVVRRNTLGLIALFVIVVFVVAINKILCGRYTLYKCSEPRGSRWSDKTQDMMHMVFMMENDTNELKNG